jgi:hypothetical protein
MPKTKIHLLKTVLFFIFAFVFFAIAPNITHAATRFWVGGGSSANWAALLPLTGLRPVEEQIMHQSPLVQMMLYSMV